jgi:hypothetical protein
MEQTTSRYILSISLLLMTLSSAFAQEKKTTQTAIIPSYDVDISYAAHLPAGVLANRFGWNNNLGIGVHYKNPKLFFYGISGSYFFGYNVKEDVLKNLRTKEGEIIGKDAENAFMVIDQRGFNAGAHIGKIFPLSKKLPESGIRVSVGLGYLQHWIRIKDDNATVPGVTGDYKKGYDRLTAGGVLSEFVGYQYISKRGFLNLFAGFELMQGVTKSQRSWDFDLMQRNDKLCLDLLQGFRIGWTLDIRQRKSDTIFY